MEKWLIALHGPTASGKTSLAIDIAKRYSTEILSADSRQFFKELNIGVARPSSEELAAVVRHFIGFISIQDKYSAGTFERDASLLLTELFKKHDVVVVTGGSGMYLKAVLYGLDDLPDDPAIRTELVKLFEKNGLTALQDELKIVDPKYYSEVDINNPHRLMRALEVCRCTGKTYSSLRIRQNRLNPFEVVQIGIRPNRDWLYERINARVDEMIRVGLEKEAYDLRAFRHLNALNTVGYKEWFNYFDGITARDEVINHIKQHTRNFAKRQSTWYNKQQGIEWFEPEIELAPNVISYLESIIGHL